MIFDPFRAIDRLAAGVTTGGAGTTGMPVDLYREGDRYVMKADLPGVQPGSVDVSVDGQVLTIRAERAVETSDGVQWLLNERPSLSLLRQFSVSDDIDRENITAQFENGVLTVVVPVAQQARARKIQISGSQTQQSIQAGESEPQPEEQAHRVPAEVNA
jgi:HSP20 family protein